MPRFAQFDPSSTGEAPVIGWYDTSMFHYPNLPAVDALVEVTPAQWALHFNNPNGWVVANGALTELTSLKTE